MDKVFPPFCNFNLLSVLRPFTERELAVGVESGVLVWSLDASLKPTANKARVLTAPAHSPISSVQYSSNVSTELLS